MGHWKKHFLAFFKQWVQRWSDRREMARILREKRKLAELERLVLLSNRGKGLGSFENRRV